MKELLLKGIFEAVQELESFVVLDVPDEVISIVARVVSVAEKSGVRVDWLNLIIDEVSFKRDHAALAIKTSHLSNQVAKLREELGKAEGELGVVRAEMAPMNFYTGPVANEKICIIADP